MDSRPPAFGQQRTEGNGMDHSVPDNGIEFFASG
jgi:hypothetical protein